MTATTVTNYLNQRRMFNYRDPGGTPHHIFFNGKQTKTFYTDQINDLNDIILNAHDRRLRSVNSRFNKTFAPSWTIVTSG